MILSAKALLDRNPNPTEEEVREALAGQLLPLHRLPEAGGGGAGRCVQEHGPARRCEGGAMSDDRSVVGQNVRKVDGVKLVTGGAGIHRRHRSFRACSYGKILPSPHAHARIRRIDAQQGQGAARACTPS